MELIEDQIKSLCNNLENESKLQRKRTLLSIRQEVLDNEERRELFPQIFELAFKDVVRCFGDQSEVCREISIKFITDSIPLLDCLDIHLPILVTIFVKRVDSEPSEEIRILLFVLLRDVIVKAKTSTLPFLNDVTNVLERGLVDPCPGVVLEACQATHRLTEALVKQFHVQSGRLVKPLVRQTAHKHSKVRLAAINALGAVILRGTRDLIQDVTGPLAERLYDSNPAVRRAVVSSVGQWFLELPDRYSHFARMLPLILAGLDDEMPEVQQEATRLWDLAGAQFLQENEEDFKDKVDYLPDAPPLGYPAHRQRPSLGCRLLVQREAAKIFPAAQAELHDWSLAVQMQSATLVYQLILHLENRSGQYVDRVWPEFTLLLAQDSLDPRLTNRVEESCKLFGIFLSCEKLLATALSQSELTLGQLRCLLCALRGLLVIREPLLGSLSSALVTTSSAMVLVQYKSCLLDCIAEILRAATGQDCEPNSSLSLFTLLLEALGNQDLEHFSSRATDLLQSLATLTKCEVPDLYEQHGTALLNSLLPTVSLWTDGSVERDRFYAFVDGAGQGIGNHLEAVLNILIIWSKKANSGRSLGAFTCIVQPLLEWKFLITCHPKPAPFLCDLLNKAILPNLIWSAGRIAEARRSQALLLIHMAAANPLPAEIVEPLAAPLLPLVIGALEETNNINRFHAAKIIALFAPAWCRVLDFIQVKKTCHGLARRLDDSNAEVRLHSLKSLKEVLLCLPTEHEALQGHSASWLKDLYKCILIHLDDPDPTYRQAIFDTLKSLCKFETQQLLDLVLLANNNFHHKDECLALKIYLEDMLKK